MYYYICFNYSCSQEIKHVNLNHLLYYLLCIYYLILIIIGLGLYIFIQLSSYLLIIDCERNSKNTYERMLNFNKSNIINKIIVKYLTIQTT